MKTVTVVWSLAPLNVLIYSENTRPDSIQCSPDVYILIFVSFFYSVIKRIIYIHSRFNFFLSNASRKMLLSTLVHVFFKTCLIPGLH